MPEQGGNGDRETGRWGLVQRRRGSAETPARNPHGQIAATGESVARFLLSQAVPPSAGSIGVRDAPRLK